MFTKDVGHFEPLARISVLAFPPASNIHPITSVGAVLSDPLQTQMRTMPTLAGAASKTERRASCVQRSGFLPLRRRRPALRAGGAGKACSFAARARPDYTHARFA